MTRMTFANNFFSFLKKKKKAKRKGLDTHPIQIQWIFERERRQ